MPNSAPTKKQVMNGIISIFINARPVTWIGSALCARKSAMMDMMWASALTNSFYIHQNLLLTKSENSSCVSLDGFLVLFFSKMSYFVLV